MPAGFEPAAGAEMFAAGVGATAGAVEFTVELVCGVASGGGVNTAGGGVPGAGAGVDS